METVGWSKEFHVWSARKCVWDAATGENRRLVRPTTGDVADRVSTTAKDEQWKAEGLDELDAFTMSGDAEIEASETVKTKRVSAALEDNRGGPESCDCIVDHLLEYGEIHVVIDSVLKWYVQTEMLA